MSPLPLEATPKISFAHIATRTLERLWPAVHGEACPTEVRSLLATMLARWGSRPVPEVATWPSDIGSDHSPFEFSLALTSSGPELRFLVEAQGNGSAFSSVRQAGLELNASLAKRGADLRRFEQLRDLFLPEVTHARFGLWHAATLTTGKVRAKAYLNPQIRGQDQAVALVKSGFERLKMPAAWTTVERALRQGERQGEEIRYFAIDLQECAMARAKVYLYPKDASAENLEKIAALRPEYVSGEVTDFCDAIAGDCGPYGSWPPCVYLAFTGDNSTPSDVTVQIPIAHYVRDDRVARDRILSYLRQRGLDWRAYERAVGAATTRQLAEGRGLHTYVSLRTGSKAPRVTVYFAAELYAVHEPATSAKRLRSVQRADGAE